MTSQKGLHGLGEKEYASSTRSSPNDNENEDREGGKNDNVSSGQPSPAREHIEAKTIISSDSPPKKRIRISLSGLKNGTNKEVVKATLVEASDANKKADDTNSKHDTIREQKTQAEIAGGNVATKEMPQSTSMDVSAQDNKSHTSSDTHLSPLINDAGAHLTSTETSIKSAKEDRARGPQKAANADSAKKHPLFVEGRKTSEASAEAVDAVVVGPGVAGGEDEDAVAVFEDQTKKSQKIKNVVVSSSKNILSKKKVSGTTNSSSKSPSKKVARKQSTIPVRGPVRLPPIPSPGLLIPPGAFRGQVQTNADGLASPDAIFNQALINAGYYDTHTNGSEKKLKVKHTIDDLFDTNVKISSFPKLVPDEFLKAEETTALPQQAADSKVSEADVDGDKSAGLTSEKTEHVQETAASKSNSALPEAKSNPEEADALPMKVQEADSKHSDIQKATKPTAQKSQSAAERLIQAFEVKSNLQVEEGGTNRDIDRKAKPSRKRRRVMGFSDMAPLSLVLPYPNKYLFKHAEYRNQLFKRKKGIVPHRKAQESMRNGNEDENSEKVGTDPSSFEKAIPHILTGPEPPTLNEMDGIDLELFEDKQHPLYPPKNALVDHLDKRCFHITEGRYFGLYSNFVADPHFVGPSASSRGGMSFTSTTSLSTANTSAGSGGAVVIPPAPQPSLASTSESKGKGGAAISKNTSSSLNIVKSGKNSSTSKGSGMTATLSKVAEKKRNGPAVTATASALRKMMDQGDETAEKMKWVIIRAAVHAARAGKHDGRSFRAFNGQVYPDVCKAFGLYAGLKPCSQCKNNKQGTYHCRLRRKHTDPDYDGKGNSWDSLARLFELPMEVLVIKLSKKK